MYNYIVAASVVLSITYLLSQRYSKGLNKYNGPFLASVSQAWRLWYCFTHNGTNFYVNEHRRYGHIVRVGPNELSFSDPRAIQDIYGPKGASQKSEAYGIMAAPMNGEIHEILFSGMDEQWHDRQLRLTNPLFSTTRLLMYEPSMDGTIKVFCKQFRRRFTQPGSPPVNVMEWMAFLSLDLISDLTFGERSGFLENGLDVGEQIGRVRAMMDLPYYFMRMPILDKIWRKNPFKLWLERKGILKSPPIYGEIVARQFVQRQQYWQESMKTPGQKNNLTDDFFKAQAEHPEVPEFQPFAHSMAVMGAGTETTAATLSTIFYFLFKHPQVHQTLLTEVSTLSLPISYTSAQNLPYLSAVLHESLRHHPLTRLPFTRLTPPSGLTIASHHIPGGVEVGVLASVIHSNTTIFGSDADTFRPERWLIDDKEKVQAMKNTLMGFGVGKYSCLGRNLTWIMLVKIVCMVLRESEFEMVNPDKEWTLAHGAFAYPTDFLVYVKNRGDGSGVSKAT